MVMIMIWELWDGTHGIRGLGRERPFDLCETKVDVSSMSVNWHPAYS